MAELRLTLALGRLVIILLLVGTGCAPVTPAPVATVPVPPPNMAVLLVDESGQAGALTITNEKGTRSLDQVNRAVDLAGSPTTDLVKLEPETVTAIFGDALKGEPLRPLHYVLHFQFDSDTLTPESQAQLPDITRTVRQLKSQPDLQGYPFEIIVIGHTDRAGPVEFNYGLGLERALVVKDILVRAGLAADRIEVSSHGENNPVVPTPEGVREEKNRRVEVTIR